MSRITFVIGGARSGKSTFAKQLAKNQGNRVVYIATSEVLDSEMAHRIKLHKQSRPRSWQTIEEPIQIVKVIRLLDKGIEVILIDCLTLLVSNMFLGGMSEKKIVDEIARICCYLKKSKASTIIVSNEVGLGIVPDNKLARDFRDIAGRVNQLVAKQADEVYMMCAGLSVRLK